MNDLATAPLPARRAAGGPRTASRAPFRTLIALSAALFLVALGPAPAAAQYGGPSTCAEPGMNLQCNDFGSVGMQSQADIRGEPVDLSATITLQTAYLDRDARWILFSVRNVTAGEPSPVTISLEGFATAYGDVIVTETRDERAGELALWVHVVDVPVGTAITLDLSVGATERGAFRLELLVMPFDRGYAPITDYYGAAVSLFSFTLLGVNEETGSGAGGSGGSSGSDSGGTALLSLVHIVPQPWLAIGAAVLVLGAALLVLAVRRRSR